MGAKDAVLRTAGSLSTYVRNNPEIVNRATDIWAENNRLSKEIKKLELQNAVQIQKITQRYELCRDVLTQIFAERSTALMAHHQTITRRITPGRSITCKSGISCHNLHLFSRFKSIHCLLHLHDRSRTLQTTGIDFQWFFR